ncbi:MAG TPA: alpha/beta hydrolase-fold protein, partial [Polyangia bacterium]|nr:alpha/beta hydrolase-fold protein [Polyangia bacterium]
MKLLRVSLLCALATAACGQSHEASPRPGDDAGSAGAGGSGGGGGATTQPPHDGAGPSVDAPAPNDAGLVEAAPARDAGVMPVDSSATDPGTDGDGVFMLTGPYKKAPEYTLGAGVPAGKTFSFTMGAASTIYPKAPTTRKITVFVPAQYKTGTPAPVMVFQDGTDFYGFDTSVPPVFANLIAKGAMPPVVAVFAGNGGGDSVGSERGLEYDTVSGLYAAWVDGELLPRVEMETATQLPAQAVTFTKDPEGRGAVGGSSGGAATFSMAWWHPDLFRRVITFSGTFVNQVPASSPFPHGCWVYHDEDPYDATAPNGLIV